MAAAILDVDRAFAEARKLGAARAEEILSGPDMLTDAAIVRLIGVKREAVRRQAKSQPIVEALAPWLGAKLAIVSGKSKLAEAIRYALASWEGLTRFLGDGRIELYSNTVERAIRPIAPKDRSRTNERDHNVGPDASVGGRRVATPCPPQRSGPSDGAALVVPILRDFIEQGWITPTAILPGS